MEPAESWNDQVTLVREEEIILTAGVALHVSCREGAIQGNT